MTSGKGPKGKEKGKGPNPEYGKGGAPGWGKAAGVGGKRGPKGSYKGVCLV